jgi:long-chain acyl-CoA synthetase
MTFHLTVPFTSLPTVGELVAATSHWARENMHLGLPRVLFVPLGEPRGVPVERLTGTRQQYPGPTGRLAELEGYCSKDVHFDRDNTDRLLGPCDYDWRKSLSPLLNYAVYHGFIHPSPRTVHETILHRLESKSIPVSIADVIDGRIVRRDTSQVREQILAALRALRTMGVTKGDKVGIVGLNSSRYFILDVAIGLAGAVSVPIYYTSPPGEIRDILSESNARVVFVGSPEVLKGLGDSGLEVPVVSFCREDPSGPEHEHLTWEEFLMSGNQATMAERAEPVGFGDLATIRYTSGTTGRPKGVCFDHENLRWMGEAVCSLFPWKARSREITYLSFLPMNHCVEGIICAYAPYYAPASLNIYFLEEFRQLSKALPMVRPTALVKSPLPSASIRILSPTPWCSPQAFITNTSLTETQAIASTPFFFKSAACCLKLGRWRAEQVGDPISHAGNPESPCNLTSSTIKEIASSDPRSDEVRYQGLQVTLLIGST